MYLVWGAGITLVVAWTSWVGFTYAEYSRQKNERFAEDSLRVGTVLSEANSLGGRDGARRLRSLSEDELAFAARLVENGSWPSRVDSLLATEAARRDSVRAVAALRGRVTGVLHLARVAKTIDGHPAGWRADPERVKELIQQYPYWDDRDIATVANRFVKRGMSKQQLRESLGPPDRTRRVVEAVGVLDLWIYERGANDLYVHMQNDRVTKWSQ